MREDGCTNCKGNAQNISILNAYFSDDSGNPFTATEICEGTGPFFISLLYTTQQNKSSYNFRIITDILKRKQGTNEILESFYLNEYSGTISSCRNDICVITIPIPDLDFNCNNEYYEMSNPMSFWTPNANQNLEESYECNDYATAQCTTAASIPIEVESLAYDFDINFECFQENMDRTNVSFAINSLFGGNPNDNYIFSWVINIDGTEYTSNEVNPTFSNVESGKTVSATLTITQNPITGETESHTATVPLALNEEDVIENHTIIDSEEGENSGSIEVEFKPGNFSYFWTSVDDPDFYSEEAKIENLPDGTYVLTTYDDDTGLCRTDVFEIFSILPVELMYFNAENNSLQNTIELKWATAKEWESSHFEVLRSFDNLENWQKIGEVEAAGFSDQIQEYVYTDRGNYNFYQMAYYQLKQVDIDQTYDHSEVISVVLANSNNKNNTWTVYPNPTHGEVTKLILTDQNEYEGGTITATLVNPAGGSIVISGNDISTLSDQVTQALIQSTKGVYVLHLVWEEKEQQIKILKH